ncbi:hypothetical protein T11_8044 [Trichinella zimbabwensis]|uniref:Uncharacterized protein n=1 Tax=Trichinella zimbabwensis TaxID=268475 RepID=A0A0V1HTC9_9BILA|nr:hypothetical protein T11_8044 [Trichinella zimbabwensis]
MENIVHKLLSQFLIFANRYNEAVFICNCLLLNTWPCWIGFFCFCQSLPLERRHADANSNCTSLNQASMEKFPKCRCQSSTHPEGFA